MHACRCTHKCKKGGFEANVVSALAACVRARMYVGSNLIVPEVLRDPLCSSPSLKQRIHARQAQLCVIMLTE